MARRKQDPRDKRGPIFDDRVAVIVDTRDGRKDRMVPRDVARQMLKDGKLHWDLTNKQYGSDKDLPEYPFRG